MKGNRAHTKFESEQKYSNRPFNLEDLPQRELIILYFKEYGGEEVPSRSDKYVTLTNPKHEGEYHFIGKNGAIRWGTNVSTSISMVDVWPHLQSKNRSRLIRWLRERGY